MIISDKLKIKELKTSDVSKKYVSWLNNKNINKYIEARFTKHTIKSQKKYILALNKSKNDIIFGIFTKQNIHIGNVKIGPINFIHKFTEISYLIGDKKYQRKGYSFEAISLIENYIFNKLKIKKITAGVYSNNFASIKLLKKLGFKKEGVKISQCIFNRRRIDVFSFYKTKK
tara:strand:+ start:335 stop:850 length:516 start_codon:yes stop_codon:yes gene_type:complete